MKVLIAPMSAMTETSGPFSRAVALCHELIRKKHKVAFCSPEDINYRKIENVKNYYAPIPSPFGTPIFIGKKMLKLGQFFRIQEDKKINSFEHVLHFIGAISKKYFYEDVFYIRKAIQDFQPDVIYAEFRISAIVAAKLEGIKVVTGYSYPVQKSFASNPEYSTSVKRFLKENNLQPIDSVLDIFDWADLKIVLSSYELEPIDSNNIVFTGPFFRPNIKFTEAPKNKIIAYMGFGTINITTMIDNLTKAFENTNIEVYIATRQVKPYKRNNIIVDERFDFNQLMPEAIAYINHGGQNSIMTGLIYGVPQIIYPGNVFERRYNASSIVNLKAGISLEVNGFNYVTIKNIVNDFIENPIYANNAKKSGIQLLNLGGVNKAVEVIEAL
ncbi:hypothetical protein CSC2_50810 [Clostridium zeae]|uniref:Erythromycin biosynthesis protein CIII-like C-terminal domain-containing protein n=1 Tax=Clostridium zeae TaxID=2759022 RepID=A0ABQ1EIA0_9CLOT|nr:nucleotide disphospho-sugar-binding domain-containing protein [Clostridium zeae]GFZ34555.1 hypothetical protein CSC2_50810 [Clostridium zeae]